MSRTRTVVTALVVALLTACALVVVLAKRQINLSRAYLELR